MGDETPDKPQDQPQDTSVDGFIDIEIEVNKHFGGDWKKFLTAVANPAEIMHFVLTDHFGKDTAKFEAWAKEQELPPDWVPRFYGTLTPKGDLQEAHKFEAGDKEAAEAEAKD